MKSFLLFFLSLNALASLLPSEKQLINVYEQTVPSVVNVSNVITVQDFFLGAPQQRESGAGSGFVWDDQGHIVTNFHVVQNQRSEYYISFHGSKEQVKAKIVGVEPKLDIAVLKVDKIPAKTKAISVGQSKGLAVGQMAIAIGNPFGLDHTMTSGIISALGRSITGIGGVKINDMIQTDAHINPGNSGGPLMNSQGELIGMNTMIYSSSGSSAGLGFAVPVDAIKNTVPQLIEHGKVIRPALGISPLPDHYRRQLIGDDQGVVIGYVLEGSPAEKAGLKGMRRTRTGRLMIGDIILKIDKHDVNSLDDIFQVLSQYKIGDTVQLSIKDDSGQVKRVPLKLQAL